MSSNEPSAGISAAGSSSAAVTSVTAMLRADTVMTLWLGGNGALQSERTASAGHTTGIVDRHYSLISDDFTDQQRRDDR